MVGLPPSAVGSTSKVPIKGRKPMLEKKVSTSLVEYPDSSSASSPNTEPNEREKREEMVDADESEKDSKCAEPPPIVRKKRGRKPAEGKTPKAKRAKLDIPVEGEASDAKGQQQIVDEDEEDGEGQPAVKKRRKKRRVRLSCDNPIKIKKRLERKGQLTSQKNKLADSLDVEGHEQPSGDAEVIINEETKEPEEIPEPQRPSLHSYTPFQVG